MNAIWQRLRESGALLVIITCLILFWVFLFYGIIGEQDRREKTKSSRKWMQEKAVNQYETEHQTQLLKAMYQVREEK